MQKEFLLLEEVIIEKSKKCPVYYIANPGNYGDALIRYATLKFFRDIGLNFTELTSFKTNKREWWPTRFQPNAILIFGGGGAWCDLWNHESLVKKASKHFKHIIVLPSTYEITPSISNATYFCRDQYESKEQIPDALFCHDMAFYLGSISTPEGKGTGYFFRTDKESAGMIEIPMSNNDISSKGNHNTPIYSFFDETSQFSIIMTDRLHVAIAASLMGKEVHLYAGSYFKNRAVYLSTLKKYFPNVHFHEKTD
ncbi:MAG: polysaccharide pyruvyl transferase family protein [Sulfuricurvum sp.]|uniref:polysaccharide pyruvyl transferase family protein n=1 Tax=Sulfuricurvum sp. TaxID=2025608 RepID=UPI00261F33E4|nr:polysaccharide pyruvyl transferase family protein [Sulfuricurvum sp.]MDD5159198.1 polysaccharide pyruvyl transferase family protein [Sulfuricurvum sp.]